jgi:hypothetical protein
MGRQIGSARKGRCRCCDMMREELCHALVEAQYELDMLPENEEGALVGVYAVMDDLRTAFRRIERFDLLAKTA